MISTAICGNSVTSRKNRSLEIIKVVRSLVACTVAVRGTSHRIAISPTKSFLPICATTIGPSAVSTITSAVPSMTM